MEKTIEPKFTLLKWRYFYGWTVYNLLLVGILTITLGGYQLLHSVARYVEVTPIVQNSAQAEERLPQLREQDEQQRRIEDVQTWCIAHGAKLGRSSMKECMAVVGPEMGVKINE